jgi:hypothetical protein|tara:strand:- start:4099 stop:4230 length:132 start_codon:yes stop_codon:yes gene_type:complete
VIAAFDIDFWNKTIWKIFSALSFIITTIGFVWIAFRLLMFAIQ